MTGNESQSAAVFGANVASPELVEMVEGLESEAAAAAAEPVGEDASRAEAAEPSPDGTEPEGTDEAGVDNPEPSTDAPDAVVPPGIEQFADDKELYSTLERVAAQLGDDSEGDLKVLTNRVTSNKILGRKLREIAAQGKDDKALIKDGHEYRKLFTDEKQRQEFMDWKAGKSRQTTPANPVDDDVDPLDLDGPGLAAWIAKKVDAGIAAREERVQKQTSQYEAQVAEKLNVVQTNLETVQSEFFSDVSDEDWTAAKQSAHAELSRYFGDDEMRLAEALSDPGDVYDLLDRHLTSVRKDSQLDALRQRVNGKQKKVARKAQAASTPGRRVAETEPDLSTLEGRLVALERDAPGEWKTRPGT